MHLNLIDLFCGIGGFSYGFCQNPNVNLVAGFDIDKSVQKTFEFNHKKLKPKTEQIFYNQDLRKEISEEWKDKIDIIIGSPPCQGFSDARGSRYLLDDKNDLIFKFLKWIEVIQPKIALMENVSGLLTIGKSWTDLNSSKKNDIDFMEVLKFESQKIGYNLGYKLIDSYNFGIPQKRKRVFCIFVKNSLRINPSLPIVGSTSNNLKYSDNLSTAKNYFPKIIKANPNLIFSSSIQYKKSSNLDQNFEKDGFYYNFNDFVFDTSLESITSVKSYEKVSESLVDLIEKIPEGKMYRTDRLGPKNVPVWDLFNNIFSKEEILILKIITILRTIDRFKTKKGTYDEGYIKVNDILNIKDIISYKNLNSGIFKKLNISDELKKIVIKPETIQNLVKNGWLKYSIECIIINKNKIKNEGSYNKIVEKIKTAGKLDHWVPIYNLGGMLSVYKKWKKMGLINLRKNEKEVDITQKAGHRGKYYRIGLDYSKTLLTNFTSHKFFLHPYEQRGLSLREGARLMSFPDSFEFKSNFTNNTRHIGNAVPPLIGKILSDYIINLYFNNNIILQEEIEKNKINMKLKKLANFI